MKFFSDELVEQVTRRAAENLFERVDSLCARFDAIEAGLGDRMLARVRAEWERGAIKAIDIPHRLAAELEQHKRGHS